MASSPDADHTIGTGKASTGACKVKSWRKPKHKVNVGFGV